MTQRIIVIFDHVEKRRAAIYREFRKTAHSIPISHVDDLGHSWPDRAWFLVHDAGTLLEDLREAMACRQAFSPILSYGESASVSQAIAAVRRGALSFIQWPFLPRDLDRAISDIAERAEAQSQRLSAQFAARRKIDSLSPRELSVLEAIGAGLSSKEMARELGISPRTVEIFRANAIAKLGVRNSIEAVRIWLTAEVPDDPARVMPGA